jgi:hypothetical protein
MTMNDKVGMSLKEGIMVYFQRQTQNLSERHEKNWNPAMIAEIWKMNPEPPEYKATVLHTLFMNAGQ